MISSEVQRTLVKSPPELWSELSDPDSLARHLSALGEIRITRATPEKLVEWEGERASGSVAIKASGWGTKVTLRVERDAVGVDEALAGEVSEGDVEGVAVEVEADAEVEAGAEGTGSAEVEGSGSAPAREGGEGVGEAEPETALAGDPASDAVSSPEHDAVVEPEPVPASDPEPVAESDPEPIVASEPEPAKEARRGFFARLFSRRHRKPESQPQSIGAEPVGADIEQAPDRTPAPASSAIEALQARFAAPPEEPATADTTEAERHPPGSGTADVHTEKAATPPESTHAEPPVSDAADADRAADTRQVLVADAATGAEPGDSEPRVDLAAELKAAEEAVAAQDTAVLTAVLDRLGAAHHRPFSRA